MRLHNNPKAFLELTKSKHLLTNFPYVVNKKTIIELGMGKGEMLTQLAKQNPKMLFIGIEKYSTVAYKAAKRADELKIDNFKIICEDIIHLPNLIKGKVDTLWLTFADPWPKVRHEKRRLTNQKFLELYKNILNKNGVLKFKTDNDELFKYSIMHMREYGWKLTNITKDFHAHKTSINNIMTEYEKKWLKANKKINYLEARWK